MSGLRPEALRAAVALLFHEQQQQQCLNSTPVFFSTYSTRLSQTLLP
jgi:hypothetical protein